MAEVISAKDEYTLTVSETKVEEKHYNLNILRHERQALEKQISALQDRVKKIDALLAEADKLGIKDVPSISEKIRGFRSGK